MHIPDGFLSPPVWATLDVLSIPAVGWMARRAQRDTFQSDVGDRRIPLLGVMGAFVFAAQMINFPIPLGTSAHLVGGALLAMTLGPASATVVMTAILAVQAFVFQDGGVMALGANIANMAVAGVLAGYLPYRMWAFQWRSAAIFAGGMLSVLVSGCLALAELALSGVPMPGHLLSISLGLFLVSAVLEGAITLAAVRAIERLNPAWLREPASAGSRVAGVVAVTAVLLATVAVLVTSAAPETVENLAAHAGIAVHAPEWVHAPLPNYEWRGLPWAWARKALAGLTGLVLIYGICAFAGRLFVKARQRSA